MKMAEFELRTRDDRFREMIFSPLSAGRRGTLADIRREKTVATPPARDNVRYPPAICCLGEHG